MITWYSALFLILGGMAIRALEYIGVTSPFVFYMLGMAVAGVLVIYDDRRRERDANIQKNLYP